MRDAAAMCDCPLLHHSICFAACAAVVLCSSADVFAKGAIAAANVTMQGTGRVTLAGVQQAVTADLSGISSLFVDATSGVFELLLHCNDLSSCDKGVVAEQRAVWLCRTSSVFNTPSIYAV